MRLENNLCVSVIRTFQVSKPVIANANFCFWRQDSRVLKQLMEIHVKEQMILKNNNTYHYDIFQREVF